MTFPIWCRRTRSVVPGKGAVIAAAILLLAVSVGGPALAQPIAAGETETITAAIPQFWPPHYIAEDGAEPTGFGVEILNAVAARAGYRVSYQVTPTVGGAMDTLIRGEVDVMPNVGIVPARKKLVSFTEPVETFVVSLFVRADSQGVTGIADFDGGRVGTVVRNIGNRILLDYPKIEPVVFDDIREALFDLLAGRIDGLIYPVPVIDLLTQEIGISDRIKRAGKPLREIKRGIAVHPTRVEIHNRLSAVTKEFVKTAEYREIYTKWFAKPSRDWPLEKVVTRGGAGLAVLIVIFSGWHYFAVMRMNRALEKRVELRTKELRDAQDEVVRSERLATLGQLTGTMAHELRNPIGSVVTAFEIIKRKARDPDYDLTNSLNRAERSIGRCTRIINELLDYAQVKRPGRSRVDADPLVAEVLDDYAAPATVTIGRDLSAPNAVIEGDAEQIRRLLINFLDNGCDAIAEKAARDGELSEGRLGVSTAVVDGGLEIVVSDNGIGIAPDTLERIFEPLFSTKPFGVGLGLPNAQNIVSAHGGKLSVSSDPESGTRMHVWFPSLPRAPDRKAVA